MTDRVEHTEVESTSKIAAPNTSYSQENLDVYLVLILVSIVGLIALLGIFHWLNRDEK